MPTTAANVTSKQIEALKRVAGAAKDKRIVSACERALLGSSMAVGICARAIAAAEAAADPRDITLDVKGVGRLDVRLRGGVVVGACGSDPRTWIGLTEKQARHRAANGHAIDEARRIFCSDDIEVADDAVVTDGVGGVWVSARVWVSNR